MIIYKAGYYIMERINGKLKDVVIPKDNPFGNDLIGRENCAEILTQLVDVYAQSGCVLSLNGKWGSGKTTFVKMWKQYLVNKGFKTLYFNAWEQDYLEDPLMALVSEMRELDKKGRSLKQVVANAGQIAMAAVPALLKTIIKNKFGIDNEALTEALNKASYIGEEYLKECGKQKAAFERFKADLQKFVDKKSGGKPIVFFIDELDRCRPDYAVKVLERIKHLFDVEKIVFVLSINKVQLSNAVQGFYGTPNVDAADYLRRFIDVEYDLPNPQIENFISYLYEAYSFDSFMNSPSRIKHNSYKWEVEKFKLASKSIPHNCSIDLRTIERIFLTCRIGIQGYITNSYVMLDVFFLLCVLKVLHKDVYNNIEKKNYSIQELVYVMEEILFATYSPYNKAQHSVTMEWILGEFLFLYNYKDYHIDFDENFVGQKEEGTAILAFPFETKKFNKKLIDESLTLCNKNMYENYGRPLNEMIDKINLLDSVK